MTTREMKWGDRLYNLLVAHGLHFIQQQGQEDGGGEAECQPPDIEHERVPDSPAEERARQEILEMPQAHPLAVGKAEQGLVILERQQDAPHGRIAEYDIPQQHRDQQQICKRILLQVFPQCGLKTFLFGLPFHSGLQSFRATVSHAEIRRPQQETLPQIRSPPGRREPKLLQAVMGMLSDYLAL